MTHTSYGYKIYINRTGILISQVGELKEVDGCFPIRTLGDKDNSPEKSNPPLLDFRFYFHCDFNEFEQEAKNRLCLSLSCMAWLLDPRHCHQHHACSTVRLASSSLTRECFALGMRIVSRTSKTEDNSASPKIRVPFADIPHTAFPSLGKGSPS